MKRRSRPWISSCSSLAFVRRVLHHKVGELQVKYNAVTDIAIVSGDIDGNGKADFQIEVHSAAALAKADFIL